MSAAVVHKKAPERRVSRPLKILIPLVQEELAAANEAGLEHYRKAGDLLVEAKDLVTHGSWSTWLKKNFELSRSTAASYMKLARLAEADEPTYRGAATIEKALGLHPRKARHAVWGNVRDAADKVNVTRLADERQAREKEIKLHQELALKLIDLGFRALATRLHPDRGGSRDAMSRLNTVRDELKEFAATRRFV